MANSFVKWCRAKFFNGYKHINVMAQEEGCGRSDTETLVRACEDDLLPTPAPTPTPHAHTHAANSRSHIASGTYVEEVSCDVSVAAVEADRREFSFTLYDFDGHGKVTKDDIAGLVRTIYEAVGSSLSLPPSGSRTIRVKLTVAPENCRGHHDCQEARESKKDDDDEPCEHPSGRSHRRRKARRRSTSLQRHELLQIIQANMEKNNLFYTPLHRRHDHHHHDYHHDHHHNRRRRRHGCGCDHSGSPPDPAEVKARLLEPECPCRHTHYHSHTHGANSTARSVGCRRHNRSHSHDLSHDSPHVFRYHLLDKTFQPLPPSNTPDQPPSPPMAHNPHNHQQQHEHQTRHYHHHHRSRSFDAGDTQGSSPRGRSRRLSRSQQQNQSQPQNQPKEQPQTSPQLKQEYQGGSEVSPHHTKHRHREADHARAMAQVVAWLERGSLFESQKPAPSPESGGINAVGGGSGACREQTHHVHQHIHHHYHHYAEKQPPPLLI